VTRIIQQMNDYDQLNLNFLDVELGAIDIETKKTPEAYINTLKQKFQTSWDAHNAVYGQWTQQ